MNKQQKNNGTVVTKRQDQDKKKDQRKKSKLDADQDEEDDQSYGEEDANDDQWFSDSTNSENEEDKQEREPRLIMYAAFTQYDVVKEVGKVVFNHHLTKNDQKDWDIAWFDGAISLKFLQKMWPHQRTNHFPGMYNLARKNCLGRHLMRMQKWFPEDYGFFPQTFMLPTDYKDFKNQITAKRNKTFIVKPEASCQGKGIFLTRNYEDCDPGEHYVVQRYMHKPYLIDGYKFDLRIYVLLSGVNPLRIYIYKEGLARFATVPYESPTPQNLENLFMHLTNYAINKDNENFVANTNEQADDVGSKRSFTSVLKRIAQDFNEQKADEVFKGIQDLIIKTMCIAQPYLQHLYRSAQPDDVENQMCCQVLGFDVMLDHLLVPQLLEVNQSPSFTTDSPLDYKIKKALITDTIKLWNLSIKRKLRTKGNKRAEMQKRLLKLNNNPIVKQPDLKDSKNQESKLGDQPSQQQPIDPKLKILKPPIKPHITDKQLQKQQLLDEREQNRKKKMLHREKVEKDLQGDYILIYPLVSYEEEFSIQEKQKTKEEAEKIKATEEEDSQTIAAEYGENWQQQCKYKEYMEKAKQLWESFTQGNAISKKKKEQEQKEKDDLLKKEKDKKKQVLYQKMKKQHDERKAREEEERKKQMEFLEQYNLERQQIMGQEGELQKYGYLNMNQNHHQNVQYRNPSTGPSMIYYDKNYIRSQAYQESQQKAVPQQLLEFSPQLFQQKQAYSKPPSYSNTTTDYTVQSNRISHVMSSDGSGNQGGFYLPEVNKYQMPQVKKQIHDQYQEKNIKFGQMMQMYKGDEDQALPAVPALAGKVNQSTLSNEQKPPLSQSNNGRRQDSSHSSRIQSKKQSVSIQSQQVILQNPTQRLNDLLQIAANPSYLNQAPVSQQLVATQNFTLNQAYKPQLKQTEAQINGVSHYQKIGINNNNEQNHIIRSLSLDKKDLNQINYQVVNGSQQQNKSNIQISSYGSGSTNRGSESIKSQLPKKHTSDNTFSENLSLGIVGERKHLINYQQAQQNAFLVNQQNKDIFGMGVGGIKIHQKPRNPNKSNKIVHTQKSGQTPHTINGQPQFFKCQ